VLGILGWQFNVSQALINEVDFFDIINNNGPGFDITNKFKRDVNEIPSCLAPGIQKFAAVTTPLCTGGPECPLPRLTGSALTQYRLENTTKMAGFDWDQVGRIKNYFVIDGAVLNMDSYIEAHPDPIENDLIDNIIRDVLNTDYPQGGKDATRLFYNKEDTKQAIVCIMQKYFAGNIDKQTIGCFTSDIFNIILLVVILGIVMCRFFMACIFDWFISHRLAHKPKKVVKKPTAPPYATKTFSMDEVGNDLFTVLLVTCYSEGEDGLRITCESMAATDYPDDRKLLFLICDGIITGSGNDKSTPDICIEMMEVQEEFKNPRPQSYMAIAAGNKQHNMARVYAGHFRK
jgi:chitin synthase